MPIASIRKIIFSGLAISITGLVILAAILLHCCFAFGLEHIVTLVSALLFGFALLMHYQLYKAIKAKQIMDAGRSSWESIHKLTGWHPKSQ